MTTLAEACQIAKDSWTSSNYKNGPQYWCSDCAALWQRSEKNSYDKSPIFPIDYEKNCPIHDNPLSLISRGVLPPAI